MIYPLQKFMKGVNHYAPSSADYIYGIISKVSIVIAIIGKMFDGIIGKMFDGCVYFVTL